MMFYDAKEDTKDVDLVFLKSKDLEKVKKILEKLGFKDKKELVKIFRRYEDGKNRPIMMVGNEGERIGGKRKMRPLSTGAELSSGIIKEFIFWKR